MNAEEFIEISENSQSESQSNFKLATVIDLFENKTAKIQFDGEEEPSLKQYSYLECYMPKVDDRVLLGAMSDTYIILGKVVYDEEPGEGEDGDGEEEIDRYLFDLKRVMMKKGLTVERGIITDTLKSDSFETGDISCSKINGSTASFSTFDGGSFDGSSLYASGTMSCDTARIRGSLRHSGSHIGFFGKTPLNKQSVSTASSDSNVRSTLNNLISKLKDYGLFY